MADINITPTAGQLRLGTRRPQVANLSDLTAARSGVARSGVTRSGYTAASVTTFDPFLDILIDDELRRNHVDWDSLQITLGLSSEPSTLSCTILPRGQFEIRRGQEIQVWLGGAGTGVPLFAGHMLTVTQQINRTAHETEYQVEAVDYRWLLDRFSLVSTTYRNKGVNTIVADLLATYADSSSGFKPGYLAQSLGTVSFIQFSNARITECLAQLADTVDGGAFWHVDEKKRVSIYAEPDDEGNAITVADGGSWRHLNVQTSMLEAVNRVIFLGGGSQTTATVAATATTIPVEESGWYDATGGTVQVEDQSVTYTGVSIGSGAGNLQGVTLSADIPQGTRVYNRSQQDDTDAQTELAGDLGGGQSGVSVYLASDHRFGYERTVEAAKALLDTLKTPQTQVTYDIVPSDAAEDDQLTYIRPGRLATVGITLPVHISGTHRVRSVTLTPWSRTSGGELVFARNVVASVNRRSLVQTLTEALA